MHFEYSRDILRGTACELYGRGHKWLTSDFCFFFWVGNIIEIDWNAQNHLPIQKKHQQYQHLSEKNSYQPFTPSTVSHPPKVFRFKQAYSFFRHFPVSNTWLCFEHRHYQVKETFQGLKYCQKQTMLRYVPQHYQKLKKSRCCSDERK